MNMRKGEIYEYMMRGGDLWIYDESGAEIFEYVSAGRFMDIWREGRGGIYE